MFMGTNEVYVLISDGRCADDLQLDCEQAAEWACLLF